jgi:hypothetical protein
MTKSAVNPMVRQSNTGNVKMTKTVDLTVSSRENQFSRSLKNTKSKELTNKTEVFTKHVTKKIKEVGQRNFVVDESEEIKLNFDVSLLPKNFFRKIE